MINIAGISLESLDRQPVIGVFGLFAAGKITSMNTVVGQESLPGKDQPATSIVNLHMHISDNPQTQNHNVVYVKWASSRS